MTTISRVLVVVPAKDEEELIGGCLRAIEHATARLRAASARTSCRVVVVLDDCRDGTGDVARRFDVDLVHVAARAVGAARAAGVEAGLGGAAQAPATWIACTDADSQVPPNWLTHQLELAATGAQAVVGTVRPDPRDLTALQLAAWRATRRPGRPNGHVHGANLGVRGDAYLAVGGFAPDAEHEDVGLVERLHRLPGVVVVASDEADVVTSGRLHGRTPGGYARYLRTALPH